MTWAQRRLSAVNQDYFNRPLFLTLVPPLTIWQSLFIVFWSTSSYGCTLLLNNHKCIPRVGQKKKKNHETTTTKTQVHSYKTHIKIPKQQPTNQTNKKAQKNPPKSLGGLSWPSYLGCDLSFQVIISSLYAPSLSCCLPLLWPALWTALLHQLHTSTSLLFRMQLNPLGSGPQFPSLIFSELASLISCSRPPFLLSTCNLPPLIVVIWALWEPSHKHFVSDLSWYFLLKACNKSILLKN